MTQHCPTTRVRRALAWAAAIALPCIVLSLTTQAQTFAVIHTFTGGADGAAPNGSLTFDRAGNLYGTATGGGHTASNCISGGCGTVFKLTRRNGSWIFSPLYSFQGNGDAANPFSGVTIAPDGSLYGTTTLGGTFGYGTVYNLRPAPRFSANVLAQWDETVLYEFGGSGAGGYPGFGSLIFDPAGNIYGTAEIGGVECTTDIGDCGTVFKLTPSGGGWTLSYYAFPGGADGGNPLSGVVMDAAGNLYGVTDIGNYDPVAYELSPSGSGWIETPLYQFGDDDTRGGVILDGAGNLYGTTVLDGTVYELSPSSGMWNYTLLHTFSGPSGPWNGVVQDASGNLYGTTCGDGTHGQGSVFKLTRSGGGWTETDLYEFTGGSDGSCPVGGLALDAAGDIFGTASYGGGSGCSGGCGVVWEITPL